MGFPLSYGSHGLSDHSSEPWSFSWVVKSKICNGEDHLLGLNKARALDFKRLNKKIGLSIKCEMKDPCSSGCCAHEKLVENSYRKVQRKGKKCIPPKLSPSFQLFVLKFPEQHLTSFFKSPTSFFFSFIKLSSQFWTQANFRHLQQPLARNYLDELCILLVYFVYFQRAISSFSACTSVLQNSPGCVFFFPRGS